MIDVKKIRKDFPMYRNDAKFASLPLHYLDNAATTFKPYQVIDRMDYYYKDITCNAHRGDYILAHEVDVAYEGAREIVAKFINAKTEEICFTSGDSMGINQVAYGLKKLLKPGDEILLSKAEHASNVLPWYNIAKEVGAIVKFIPLNDKGLVTVKELEETITNKTKVVSLASVSNVLGHHLDVKELVKVAHKYGAIYVDDAAQSIPHVKIDVKDLDVDFLLFSGHKMLGPTGIGVMYGKYELLDKIDPIFYGGEMNARFNSCGFVSLEEPPLKFEAGTQNIAGAMGLAKACQYIEEIGYENIREHELYLKDLAVKGLLNNGNCVIYNSDIDSGIVTFNINNVFAQDAASYLGSKGVYVRSGQHCAKILPEYLNVPATLRASFYIYNDEDDVKALVDACKTAEDFLDVFFS